MTLRWRWGGKRWTILGPRIYSFPVMTPASRAEAIAKMEEAEAQEVKDALARSRRRYEARELIAAGLTDREVMQRLWVES